MTIKTLKVGQVVVAVPKLDKSSATEALNSKLGKTIAEHMAKYMLFDSVQYRKDWSKQLNTQLANWLFGVVSESSLDLKSRYRAIKSLHYSASALMKKLDSYTAYACHKVLETDAYDSLRIVLPPNYDKGYFSDMGFELKQVKSKLGINLQLSFDGRVIADTSLRKR